MLRFLLGWIHLKIFKQTIDGGTVAPKTTADIHWLIIPTVGASADSINGTLYFVGAKLSYTVGAELEEVNVAPDFIRVKPLPEITLDSVRYFHLFLFSKLIKNSLRSSPPP